MRSTIVVVGVVMVLLTISDCVILPPATLTQVTLGCTERAVTMAALQISVKFWPASVEPTKVTVTSGAGSAEEENNGV